MAHDTRMLLETGRFAVVETDVARPDGTTAICKFVRHPGAVAVLPWVDDRHVCLIRSRRIAVGKTLIEVPAGTREPGEPPLETARRELAEETGYRAGRIEPIGSLYPSPGVLSEKIHLFAAYDLTAGDPAREANEEIENWVVPWSEALALIDRGEIEDGKTIVALLTVARRMAAC